MCYAIPSTQKLVPIIPQAQSPSAVPTRPCPLPGAPSVPQGLMHINQNLHVHQNLKMGVRGLVKNPRKYNRGSLFKEMCHCYQINLVLLANIVRNYRSASLLACKQSLLVNGRAKARVCRATMAKARVVKGLGGTQMARSWVNTKGRAEVWWPGPPPMPNLCGKRASAKRRDQAQVLCSEDLNSWQNGGEGVTF